jgi:hypothetical protein
MTSGWAVSIGVTTLSFRPPEFGATAFFDGRKGAYLGGFGGDGGAKVT